MTKLLASLILVLFLWPCYASAITAEEVARLTFERSEGSDSAAEAQMILINSKGEKRVRRLRIYTRDDGKFRYTLIRFLAPKDIAGTGFLSKANLKTGEEEQFLYLPALKRTRRIAGSFRFHRFVNSDFTYEDLERHHPSRYHHELLGEEEVDGTLCYVLKSWPKKKKDSAYSYWIRWITKDGFLPIKEDFYDKKGRLWKKFEAVKWGKVDGYWAILHWKCTDLKKNHSSHLIIEDLHFDVGLDPKMFTRRYLERW
ncbi:MAG: outer membrane lipoprotein-sorting protein [Thermodesulfobacteria bacterium]|nr:outer membrane lipoprotein-sorting protein [Thermodesulfobacteriota bacterium]